MPGGCRFVDPPHAAAGGLGSGPRAQDPVPDRGLQRGAVRGRHTRARAERRGGAILLFLPIGFPKYNPPKPPITPNINPSPSATPTVAPPPTLSSSLPDPQPHPHPSPDLHYLHPPSLFNPLPTPTHLLPSRPTFSPVPIPTLPLPPFPIFSPLPSTACLPREVDHQPTAIVSSGAWATPPCGPTTSPFVF